MSKQALVTIGLSSLIFITILKWRKKHVKKTPSVRNPASNQRAKKRLSNESYKNIKNITQKFQKGFY